MNKVLDLKFAHLESLIISAVIKPLIAIFLYFALFFRYEIEALGISGGMLAVLLGGGLFFIAIGFILFEKKLHLSENLIIAFLFFGCASILPLFSSLFLSIGPVFGIRFTLEIVIGFFMFFSFYHFIQSGKITINFIVRAVAIVGLFAMIVLLISFFDPVGAIRRLGAFGGLNYVSNSFALSIIAWFAILYKEIKLRHLFKTLWTVLIVLLMLLVLLLLGSRQALLAFFISAAIFNFVILNKTYSFLNASLFIGLSILVLVSIASVLDLSALFSRFRISTITDAAALRFQMYEASFQNFSSIDLLFGRPDYYELWATENPIHPHNFFLSLLRYLGVSVLVTYLLLIMTIILGYLNLKRLFLFSKKIKAEVLTVFLFFLIPFIYSMFSGNVTRIYSLFVFMGCLLATIDIGNKKVKNYYYRIKQVVNEK